MLYMQCAAWAFGLVCVQLHKLYQTCMARVRFWLALLMLVWGVSDGHFVALSDACSILLMNFPVHREILHLDSVQRELLQFVG